MPRNLLRSKLVLAAALGLTGLLFVTPRHAWAQG